MVKFLIEFLPLVAFFIGYKLGGIFEATQYTLVATIIATLASFIFKVPFNKINLATNILVMVSASLTLLSGNTVFIKMKPTFLYCIFGIIFLVTNYKWQPAVKLMLGSAIQLKEEKNWLHLNSRFMWFFFIMAIVNELIWRNYSEETWVNFKVIYTLPITFLFLAFQIPYLLKYKTVNSLNVVDDKDSSTLNR